MRAFLIAAIRLAPALVLFAACGSGSPRSSPTPGELSASPARSASQMLTAAPTTQPVGRIAFTWTAAGSDINNIATIAADGTDERVLTNSATVISEGVEWVPASGRLLFDSDRNGCCHLFTMDGKGGNVLPIADRGAGYPSLSADGSTIAVDAGDPQGIILLTAAGKTLRRLTTAPAPAIDTLPAFSPDGKRIAFERILDATPGQARTAIFVVNVDGTGLTQLTGWTTNASYPNWSPDGSKIVFNDNADNGGAENPLNVWVMRPDGSGLRALTHATPDLWASFGADWSPDGSRVVFVAGGTALDEMSPDGSNVVTVWHAKSGVHVDDPDWGPA